MLRTTPEPGHLCQRVQMPGDDPRVVVVVAESLSERDVEVAQADHAAHRLVPQRCRHAELLVPRHSRAAGVLPSFGRTCVRRRSCPTWLPSSSQVLARAWQSLSRRCAFHVFSERHCSVLCSADSSYGLLSVRLGAQHWIDTLKLLGQLGPIDWPGIQRNPFQLYAGIAPAIIETAAYKCAAPSPPASLCARRIGAPDFLTGLLLHVLCAF